jgi:hypothetical protein
MMDAADQFPNTLTQTRLLVPVQNRFRQALMDVAFFHIPKTAGTSVSSFFMERFSRANCYVQSDPFDSVKRNVGGQPIYYGGHMDWDLFQAFPLKCISFTFFRDPKSRLVSVYNFSRQAFSRETLSSEQRSSLNPAAAAALQYDFADWLKFLADGGRPDGGRPARGPNSQNGNDNTYVRCLLGRKACTGIRRLSFQIDGPEMMLARERLRKFVAIGMAEDFDRSMHLVSHAIGVEPPEQHELIAKNITQVKSRLSFSDRIQTLLHELTMYDRALYDYATTLYREQLLAYAVKMPPSQQFRDILLHEQNR